LPDPTAQSTLSPTLINAWIYVLLSHCVGMMGRAARTAGTNERSGRPRRRPRPSDCKLKPLPPGLCRHQNLAGRAAMSGRRLKYAAGALFGALVTSAGAADLLPPAPSRHPPHTLPLRQSPPGSIMTNHATPARGDAGWGTAFLGPSTTFSTDPSGVIGGTLFDDDYQFSPDWLTGR
jgi:hypothetical protein